MLFFCPSWSCTIICYINRFTSLCKNLFNLLEWVFGRSFSMPCASFSMLDSPGWKWYTWYRKASAKNSSKLNKFLDSEMNLLIQHITNILKTADCDYHRYHSTGTENRYHNPVNPLPLTTELMKRLLQTYNNRNNALKTPIFKTPCMLKNPKLWFTREWLIF